MATLLHTRSGVASDDDDENNDESEKEYGDDRDAQSSTASVVVNADDRLAVWHCD